jgi:hypothetical protein
MRAVYDLLMAATLAKRVEAFVVPGGLKGQISDLPVPEILQHLRLSRATGILTLVSGGARKAMYINEGRVVFASSNLPNDRLGELLIREGKITVEEYEASIRALSKGKRQGKVLVEMGALTPKDFWEGVQLQVKEIVYSIFRWEEGTFHFEESTLPEKERITVDLDIVDLILVGIRRVPSTDRIQARYPEPDLVLEIVSNNSATAVEPYEQHVREMVDGERSVLDICRESEIGDSETLKVLYALLASGLARVKGKKVRPLDQDFVPADTIETVIDSFNQMYGYIFRYMVREVGPIAENVLEKYLGTLRESRRNVLFGARLQKDGTLEPATLERNLTKLPEEERRGALVDALNELLYAELLAVKRTLGAEHEASIVRAFRDR